MVSGLSAHHHVLQRPDELGHDALQADGGDGLDAAGVLQLGDVACDTGRRRAAPLLEQNGSQPGKGGRHQGAHALVDRLGLEAEAGAEAVGNAQERGGALVVAAQSGQGRCRA